MTVPTIIHKGRLKRRLNPCYFCKIDVASKLAFVFGFKVKFLNLVSVHHHNAGLFRVGGIDKHFLGHVFQLHAGSPRDLERSGITGSCLSGAIGPAPRIAARGLRRRAPSKPVNCVSRLIAVLLRWLTCGPSGFKQMPPIYCRTGPDTVLLAGSSDRAAFHWPLWGPNLLCPTWPDLPFQG